MISADEVWELPHRHIGHHVFYFKSAGSTNDLASQLGADPARAGVVVVAGQQTAGRGQYGRLWQAPAGSSVLLSVALQPPGDRRRPAMLTAWAAISVCDLISDVTKQPARIKWPNDVLVNERKICGILIEQGSAIVAGIGLNVNQTASDFQIANLPLATSLGMISEQRFDTNDIAKSLLSELDRNYELLIRGDLSILESSWNQRLALLNGEVLAETFDGIKHRGSLRECAFAGLALEGDDGSIVRLMPEQVRSLAGTQPVGDA
jgi:BirA family biotin operon repressor/biotin-[acetyl-CoA-carboxylase] ligase